MLPLLVAVALVFPTRVAPEIPVTAPVLDRVPFAQNGVHIASNGSLALAVWNDGRMGDTGVLASRVDSGGTPLDATGIVIRPNATVSDVFWNGSSFEVLTTSNFSHYDLAFVDVDGTVAKHIPLEIQAFYGAKTDEEANTRLLFLPGSGYSPDATIVDAEGRVVKAGVPGGAGSGFLAATDGTGFLVLRSAGISERLDRDGDVLSSNNSFLLAPWPFDSLTGDGRGGFAVFARASYGVVSYMLDSRGVAVGPVKIIQPKNPLEKLVTPVVAVRTNDGYVASWSVSTTQNHAYTYVSRNGAPPVETYDWIGIAKSTAVDPATDLVLTAYDDAFIATGDDVYVQKGSGQPQKLTQSASLQSNAAIAAGANGFLAAWGEYTSTDVRLYVRRFSAAGEPQQEPLIVSETLLGGPQGVTSVPSASLASTGDTYLVLLTPDLARRLDARTGQWIDQIPISFVPRTVLAIGATNSSALAITTRPCSGQGCFVAQRIEMRGEPLLAPPVPIPGADLAAQFAIASNGTDYLVAWMNGVFNCPFECPTSPTPIMAIRLRSDGTAIDPAPFTLAANGAAPSVAWNGKSYLVSWAGYPSAISAAYVSQEGAVDPLGKVADGESSKVIAHAGEFLLFTHTVSPYPPNPDEWRAMTLGGDSAVILTRPNRNFGPLAAASNGGYLMLAYDRVDEPSGHIGRVFLDPRVNVSRRRAIAPKHE